MPAAAKAGDFRLAAFPLSVAAPEATVSQVLAQLSDQEQFLLFVKLDRDTGQELPIWPYPTSAMRQLFVELAPVLWVILRDQRTAKS